jgi:putative tryptophan/tyrosine transport system substrate-binding protein
MKRCPIELLVILALGLLVAPLATYAQRPGQMARIGVLRPLSATDPLIEAFRQGLRDLGYVEGHNVHLEYRFAEGLYERLPELAADLVRLPVDVLVTGGAPAIRAATQATSTIPIVIAFGDDPVATGLVASLARPGGNVTGLSNTSAAFASKRLELLTEAVPGLSRMAILRYADRPRHASEIEAIHAVAARVGIHLEVLEVRSPQEFERAFSTMVEKGVGAVNVLDDAMFFNERTRLAALAAKSHIPAMYGHRGYVEAGGLLSYGPNLPALFRRAATYVDKVLKGTKPGDLPVEQPTKFELVLNLKTAQALGLTIPPTLLFQADEVIR